jgi:hypothetical protein
LLNSQGSGVKPPKTFPSVSKMRASAFASHRRQKSAPPNRRGFLATEAQSVSRETRRRAAERTGRSARRRWRTGGSGAASAECFGGS